MTHLSKGLRLLNERYLNVDSHGRKERVDELFHRVSGGDPEYEEMMVSRDFLPNSPALFNYGTGKNGTVFACYKFGVADSMLDGPSSIIETRRKAATVAKWGGGVGYYLGDIRARNSLINSVHRKACGPVAVLKDLNGLDALITQGGKRALAQMGILPCWHDDIYDFVRVKDDNPQSLASFNISVSWTDAWLAEVEKGIPGKALDLWNAQVDSAWRTGDPGMFFFDTVNADNPTPWFGDITGSNPCLTDDTWVLTSDGPQQVKDLIGSPFHAMVEGNRFHCKTGFFATGTKPVFRVQTAHGFSLRATDNHRVLTVRKRTCKVLETEWKRIDEIKVGDEVVLANQQTAEWGGEGTFEQGWLVGNLLGDGTFLEKTASLAYWGENKEEMRNRAVEYLFNNVPVRCDIGKGGLHSWKAIHEDKISVSSTGLVALAAQFGVTANKCVLPAVETSSRSFHRGFLRGWFDADGSVQGKQLKGVSVRLSSSVASNLETAQRMLGRLGIISKLYMNRREAGWRTIPAGSAGEKQYFCQAQHELIISGDNLVVFDREVGFSDPTKAMLLKKRLGEYARRLNAERFISKVVAIEPDGLHPVYDCTVEGAHEYDSGQLRSHNCGEALLLDDEPCDLGSLNLKNFVTKNRRIDFTRLHDRARLAQRYLNHLHDVNQIAIPQVMAAAARTRKTGLGVMGWADALCLLHIHYDTDEAIALAAAVAAIINDAAYIESVALANRDGPYPGYNATMATTVPIRNATRTCYAPTGSIYIIAELDSGGIEPHFALEWDRKTNEGMVFTERVRAIEESGGFVPHIANQISPEWHIKHQAAFQQHTNLGISKTINLPNSATRKDVSDAYLLMWKMGCKGGTIFRDGCRSDQVLVAAGAHSEGKGYNHSGVPVDTGASVPKDCLACEGSNCPIF